MYNVKIYGAGSIGNHLAHACRNKGWNVLICDVDKEALERTKNDIYPARYGAWDENIRLSTVDSLPDESFDLVIIGTPPDIHMKIALQVLENESPKALLIEKPLCTPSLEDCDKLVKIAEEKGVFIGVAYNHSTAKNTKIAEEVLGKEDLGSPLTISVDWLEYWGGIFAAHPWLEGPQDTYLGFAKRGGGACGEHSHAIQIWLHFSHVLGMGKVTEVSAVMDMVENDKVSYDRLALLNLTTEKGLIGNVIQDVITEPPVKSLRIQGEKGFLEWYVNYEKGKDAVKYWDGNGDIKEEIISKTRPDDFKWEIDHLAEVMDGTFSGTSPIDVTRGLETMLVIAAAHKSGKLKKTVTIDYSKGYSESALV